ncbi:MAG: flagellar hook-basal body complex protein FliE [Opitutaceae bacterium]|nr:flagellar hook-basal body complex protein FliE [Opitutaceae bacterium]
MSLISSIGGLQSSLLNRLPGAGRIDAPATPMLPRIDGTASPAGASPTNFSSVFDQLVSAVDAKQTEAQDITRQVLMGQNDQLHQSVIAMQEAGVAFQLMVEVRNKLVDSYQELMRMPV